MVDPNAEDYRQYVSSTMKEQLNSLLSPHQQMEVQKLKEAQHSPIHNPKIQKVPPYLRERSEYEKYYFPRVVSIGPIHYPKGEEYKKLWASAYLKDKVGEYEDAAEYLLGIIRSEIENNEFYAEDVIEGMDKDKLAWILFLDGCASLHVINKMKKRSEFQARDNIILQDLLLLENQLPYKVLRILLANEDDYMLRFFVMISLESYDINQPAYQEGNQLPALLPDFPQSLEFNELATLPVFSESNLNYEPAHLLDLQISFMVDKNKSAKITIEPQQMKSPQMHRSIQELIKTAGVDVKKSKGQSLDSIDFRDGTLCMPPITVHDFTAQKFLNLIAYEMCPDNYKTNYEVSNYVAFLDSLIDHANDVKALRRAGVLRNCLGSDEEVAKVFNTVTSDLVLETGIYYHVRKKIEDICERQVRNWFIELQRNHFNTPWSIIGVISAILGFILTVVSLKKALTPR